MITEEREIQYEKDKSLQTYELNVILVNSK